MAFQQTPDRSAQPQNDPISSYDLDGIVRTGRFKSAGWKKQRRNPALVQRNQPNAKMSHAGPIGDRYAPSRVSAFLQASLSSACCTVKASRLG
jgi:hypothetical protein